MSKKYSIKKFFNDVHLWLGIASGIVLFLVCLSGSILAFEHEIEEFFASDVYQIESSASMEKLPLDTLIARAEVEKNGRVTAFRILEDESSAYQVYIEMEGGGRPKMFMINPFTSEIKDLPDSFVSGFFSIAFKMHRWLLLDASLGRPIVGAATIIFIVLCLTGLILWWPKKLKRLKQGLTIRFNSAWKRINYDVHNVLGFYALVLLLIMGLTGLNWSFDWYRNGMSKVLNDEVFKQRRQKPLSNISMVEDAKVMSLEQYIENADRVLDYSGDRHIILPVEPGHAVQVRKKKTGFFAVAAVDKAHIDWRSGEIIRVDMFDELPVNQKINELMKPLHTGEAFGAFSKILYFLACLIGTSLPVTGTIIWINKLKKKARKGKKRRIKGQEIAT